MNLITGTLLKIQRYSFQDQNDNNRQIQGGKVVIGIPPHDKQSDDVTGFVFQELKMDYENYKKLSSEADGLIGSDVQVECDLVLNGKSVGLKAVSVAKSESF